MNEFKRVNRELMYKGKIVDFYKDTVEIPNGNVAQWDYIAHKGAAAVIPVKANGEIIMVKQYRNALDRFTLEVPAGGLDHVEEPFEQCAKRELEEETGYRSEHIEHLIDIYTTVAFCNEKIGIYVAFDLEESKQNLDEDEFVEIMTYPIEELMNKIYSGEIVDAKTISALMAYYCKYCN